MNTTKPEYFKIEKNLLFDDRQKQSLLGLLTSDFPPISFFHFFTIWIVLTQEGLWRFLPEVPALSQGSGTGLASPRKAE